MSKRVGTPYKCGNSQVIENFAPAGGTAVAEGLAVALDSKGELKAVSSADDIVIGVAGICEHKHQSVVRNGLEVYVVLDASAAPVIGGAVHVTTAGKFTHTGGTQVNATFATGKVSGINSKGEVVECAAIDFAGGL